MKLWQAGLFCLAYSGCRTNCPEVPYVPSGPPADQDGRCEEGVAFRCDFTCEGGNGEVTCEDGRAIVLWFEAECPQCDFRFAGDALEITCSPI